MEGGLAGAAACWLLLSCSAVLPRSLQAFAHTLPPCRRRRRLVQGMQGAAAMNPMLAMAAMNPMMAAAAAGEPWQPKGGTYIAARPEGGPREARLVVLCAVCGVSSSSAPPPAPLCTMASQPLPLPLPLPAGMMNPMAAAMMMGGLPGRCMRRRTACCPSLPPLRAPSTQRWCSAAASLTPLVWCCSLPAGSLAQA